MHAYSLLWPRAGGSSCSFEGWPSCTGVLGIPAGQLPSLGSWGLCLRSSDLAAPVLFGAGTVVTRETRACSCHLFCAIRSPRAPVCPCLLCFGPHKRMAGPSRYFSLWEQSPARAVGCDEAEGRCWVVRGKGGGCWPKAEPGSAAGVKAV